MDNKQKIRQIIDKQIEKIHNLAETSKIPLMLNDIRSLSELAKLINDSENLDTKEKKDTDLFLWYEFHKIIW